jgi:hypothetical protein
MADDDLTFVDELPPEGTRTVHSKTTRRIERIRAQIGRWALWPAKTSPRALTERLESFGPGFEVEQRPYEGALRCFVRYVGIAAAENPTAAGPTSAGSTSSTPERSDRPKVRAKCGHYLAIQPGQTESKTLSAHYVTEPECEAISRRRGGR